MGMENGSESHFVGGCFFALSMSEYCFTIKLSIIFLGFIAMIRAIFKTTYFLKSYEKFILGNLGSFGFFLHL